VVYPNSGERYDAAGKRWDDGEGGAGCGLADRVDAWRGAGARLIGGCCRTTPRDIAQLARRLEKNAPQGARFGERAETRL
jgi:homocysteine S-methyltransferase